MKFPQVIFLLLLSSSSVLNAQSTPEPSAALEVRSTTQGFLLPRMTTAQRDAISSPAEGLLIYNTNTQQYNISKSSQWDILSIKNEMNSLEAGGIKTSSLEVDNFAQWSTLSLKGSLAVSASANIPGRFHAENGLNVDGSIRFEKLGAGSLQTDANGNVTTSSDERLKILEGEFTTGLEALLEVEPIQYRWNDLSGLDQEHIYVGFSAQNVQAVIPEAVGQNPHGYLTLNDRPIVAALVNVIQEINKEHKELKEKKETLKVRLEALTKRIALLESR